MKGRDVLIGVAIGAFLVLFLTNYHPAKSPPPHPKPSASAQSLPRSAAASSRLKDTKSHHPAPQHSASHHGADPRPSADAASAKPATGKSATGKAATGKPTTDALPSAHRITATRASAPAKSSGVSNGLIIIASLIAIAAALSTVTLTVRGLRANK
jgi:hypothetical protein